MHAEITYNPVSAADIPAAHAIEIDGEQSQLDGLAYDSDLKIV